MQYNKISLAQMFVFTCRLKLKVYWMYNKPEGFSELFVLSELKYKIERKNKRRRKRSSRRPQT